MPARRQRYEKRSLLDESNSGLRFTRLFPVAKYLTRNRRFGNQLEECLGVAVENSFDLLGR